jgi:hypothetical protein
MHHTLGQYSGVPREGFGGFKPPPPQEFRCFDEAEQNYEVRGKYIRNNLIRIRISPICKLSGAPDKVATASRSQFYLPSVLKWICRTPPKNSCVRHWFNIPSVNEDNLEMRDINRPSHRRLSLSFSTFEWLNEAFLLTDDPHHYLWVEWMNHRTLTGEKEFPKLKTSRFKRL